MPLQTVYEGDGLATKYIGIFSKGAIIYRNDTEGGRAMATVFLIFPVYERHILRTIKRYLGTYIV